MIGLAKTMNRKVVAEPVETEAHGTTLIKMGCHLGQGYFIANPIEHQRIPE
ncbi:hypothetical protein THMIRHAT_23150 [Thiosulfativibrio zosterae]|uniref:EAL domain-containing protein n=2 Tax=Thiosulfativibrio zosterae TaxID=2675053 RepID=A0A6F8PR30_9GAMM|nr:EAL domain-containing protein [Thiosulfativibrio zosterae]BBP44569.1 hypothetical protein THMIRHAT_23150 [Thiosulfativibrio zosterae]